MSQIIVSWETLSLQILYSFSHYIVAKGNIKNINVCVFLHMHVYTLSHPSNLLFSPVYPDTFTHEHVLHSLNSHGTLLQTADVIVNFQILIEGERSHICCDPSNLVVNLDCTLEFLEKEKGHIFCKIMEIFSQDFRPLV